MKKFLITKQININLINEIKEIYKKKKQSYFKRIPINK